MQPSFLEAIERALSRERFAGYRGRGSDVDGVVNFLWNAKLCESLYPVLQGLEVALRNALYNAIAAAYPSAVGRDVPCWLDADPPIILSEEAGRVREAKRRVKQGGKELEPGRLVSELSFGFWTALLDVRYESTRILWPRLFREQPFAGVPRRMRTRKTLSPLFNRVRLLRNRAFHHEPIWHWRDLAEQHALAGELPRRSRRGGRLRRGAHHRAPPHPLRAGPLRDSLPGDSASHLRRSGKRIGLTRRRGGAERNGGRVVLL